MAQGHSTQLISMIRWSRTSRLSIKKSLSAGGTAIAGAGRACGDRPRARRDGRPRRATHPGKGSSFHQFNYTDTFTTQQSVSFHSTAFNFATRCLQITSKKHLSSQFRCQRMKGKCKGSSPRFDTIPPHFVHLKRLKWG